MHTILGRGNISSTMICDSVNANGVRMITLEIEYPRFILAELNTHRMLSKNSSSSRAVPVNRLLEMLQVHYAEPVHWGKNQPGMTAAAELTALEQTSAQEIWSQALSAAAHSTRELLAMGVHKQIANRVTEPWHIMKTVVSGTEWANLWWLRDHPDAQPEFQELARCMQTSLSRSQPQLLLVGEWHLPYVNTRRDSRGKLTYHSDQEELTLTQAQEISTACCAQVSYRRLDQTLAKAQEIYQRLVASDPKHMSPCEHQATPQPSPCLGNWAAGISHQDRTGELWSGNLRNWIQLRKLIPNEAKW